MGDWSPPLVQPPLPQMGPTLDQEFYTYDDLAKLFKVTKQTIQHWVKNGRAPSPRYIGFTARFTNADVREIIDGPKPTNTYPVAESPRAALATVAYVRKVTGTGVEKMEPAKPKRKKPASSSPAKKVAKKPAKKSKKAIGKKR